MEQYRLYRRVKDEQDARWLSTTKGKLDYILTVLELNLTDPGLTKYEYRVSRYG